MQGLWLGQLVDDGTVLELKKKGEAGAQKFEGRNWTQSRLSSVELSGRHLHGRAWGTVG